MAQLWGGRFTKQIDELAWNFNASISFDKRLMDQDIEGSIAHVTMLAKQGIITDDEKKSIIDGLGAIKKEVENLGLSPSAHVFVEAFSNEVHRLLGAADLVISRSGAMSVAEIEAVGVPSILVPYPRAAGNHQEFNARVITDPGGGVLIKDQELTAALLIQTVESLLEDDKKRLKMSKITKELSIANAGDRIFDEISKLMET